MVMKTYKHKNYDDYVIAQSVENKKKMKLVFAEEEEIKFLSSYIKEEVNLLNFGICHGVRNGWEVRKFREFLKVEIIGTEISDTAEIFDYVIQWDFHNIQDEWIDSVDFIYSNAFCYSNKPKHCLNQWMKCIKEDGICIIEWTWHHSEKREIDRAHCFVASKEEYYKLFSENYDAKLLYLSTEKSEERKSCWFVIRHKD